MKNKKYYHNSRKRIIVDKTHIEDYLAEVRQKIKIGLCRFALNKNRQNNIDLFTNYIIDKNKAKEIILTLNFDDFSNVSQNKHIEYKDELLYIFGKNVLLEERIGKKLVLISLYIKINNTKENTVIIISFHEQKYKLKYYFKEGKK